MFVHVAIRGQIVDRQYSVTTLMLTTSLRSVLITLRRFVAKFLKWSQNTHNVHTSAFYCIFVSSYKTSESETLASNLFFKENI